MQRRAILLITAFVAIAGTGCGRSPVASSAGSSSSVPRSSPPAASQATVSPAAPSPSDPSETLSVLSVEHQVDVATQLDGVFVSIGKDEGSPVTAGDVMGTLDDRVLQIELLKARNDLQVSEDNVKYKEAEVKAKNANFSRGQQLRALGLSSEAEFEAAEFEAKGAEYDLQATRALVESSQADIHRLEIEIDHTRLRAPFSGVVARRYVREGQSVSKQEKCFRVSQLAPLQVLFQVTESSSKRPERGLPVDVFLAGDSMRVFRARVIKVGPVIDPAGDSYDVTAQLFGAGLSDLRPGMAVRVRWPGNSRPEP